MDENLKLEKKILNISFVGSVLFLLLEVACALVTGSKAILMDCVYDIADLIMIGPFMILVPLLRKPVTEDRPYGFSQVESLFVLLKYLMLLGVEVVLIFDCLQTILTGGNTVEAGVVAIFEFAISLGCIIMWLVIGKMSRKYSSPSIKAELFIWRLDAISTLGVGAAFILKLILDRTALAWLGPYIDPAIAIILAVLLAKEPISMIIESIRNLILFAPEDEIFDFVEPICNQRLESEGCRVTFTDIIKTGRTFWIQVYFTSDRNIIDVSLLKSAYREIKEKLVAEYEFVGLELIPDMEDGYKHVKPAPAERRKDKIRYMESMESKKEHKKEEKKAKHQA